MSGGPSLWTGTSENITFQQHHWRVVITMRAIWPPLGKGDDLAKSVNTLNCPEGINKLYITYCSYLVLLEGSVVRSHLCFFELITGPYIWQILPFTLCMHKRHEMILNIVWRTHPAHLFAFHYSPQQGWGQRQLLQLLHRRYTKVKLQRETVLCWNKHLFSRNLRKVSNSIHFTIKNCNFRVHSQVNSNGSADHCPFPFWYWSSTHNLYRWF